MDELSKQLEVLGHEVKMPPVVSKGVDGKDISSEELYTFKKTSPPLDSPFWQIHTERIKNHFNKVEWSDAVLITNYDKNGIKNYVGPNTLMEMGLAFHLNKKIFLLNPIPELAWKEEVIGMNPTVIDNNLSLI